MKLNENFVDELFKICLRKKEIFELAQIHIKYNYLPSEQYKEIWKLMCKYYSGSEKLLTIGLLSQEFDNKPKIVKTIAAIKKADNIDPEIAIDQLGHFIRSKMFIEVYDQIGDLYNQKKKDEVFKLMLEMGQTLTDFEIRDKSTYNDIIVGFEERLRIRAAERDANRGIKQKIPTGIPGLDDGMNGGVSRGDIALLMAASGIGKSFFLRWLGLHASRMGYTVIHIQAEGTGREVQDLYDAAFSGKSKSDIEYGNLSQAEIDKITAIYEDISFNKGRIFLKAYEQFDAADMRDIRSYVQEITDKFGQVDLLLVDYIDEVDPGDGKRYSTSNEGERKRRESTAKKFKNIAVEFNLVGWTATQANTQDDKLVQDPTFKYTRYHISEFKGLIKPFSYFLTANQTDIEKVDNVMRLYKDKWRGYKNDVDRIVSIATNYDHGRFYHHKNTVRKFG